MSNHLAHRCACGSHCRRSALKFTVSATAVWRVFLLALFVICGNLHAAEIVNSIDAERRYSSVYGNNYPATGHARSRLHSRQAWSAAINNTEQWIELPVSPHQRVVALHTQGRANNNQWVTQYRVQAKFPDGRLVDLVGGQTLHGNVDRSTVVTHQLDVPLGIIAIRILPQAWTRHISMRAAVEVESVDCAATNLVSNGSFEQHDSFSNGSWGLFTAIPGWHLEQGEIEIQSGTVSGIAAAHGQDKLELDSTGNSTIYTDLNTTAGEKYQLQFSYSPRNTNRNTDTNNVEVLWDGVVVASLSGQQRLWQFHQTNVTATSNTSRLTFRAAGRSDSVGGLLDNVRVFASDNLIENGSFESHAAISAQNWSIFSAIPGWTVANGGAEIQRHTVSGIRAVSGQDKLELDSNSNSTVYTDVSTSAEQRYRISFYYSPRSTIKGTDTNDIKVWWGDQLLTTLTGDTRSWQYHSHPVVGNSTSTRLNFEAAGRSDGIGGLLDAVSVTVDSNLLVNGSFETHGPLSQGDWGVFDEIPGWVAGAGQFELQKNSVGGIGAFQGTKKLELDGNAISTIFAQVASLAGKKYHLGFAYSPRVQNARNNTNDVEVWWEGEKLAVLTGQQRGWQQHNFALTSVSDGSQLEFKGTGKDDSYGGLIDDVYVAWSVESCETGGGENQAPTAIDQQFTLQEDTQQVFDFTATDPEQDTLTFAVVTPPQHGNITLDGTSYLYQPDEHFSGADSVEFTANDGELESEPGVISLQVTPVNDAPTAGSLEFSVNDNETVSFSLPGADVDNDDLIFIILEQPAQGRIDGEAPDLVYTPPQRFSGTETLTYKVSDGALESDAGTITLMVNRTNAAPEITPFELLSSEEISVSKSIGAIDPDGDNVSYRIETAPFNGSAEINDGVITYTPNRDFFGTDSLVIIASDGFLESPPLTVPVTITESNNAPVASGATYETRINVAIELALMASDPDDDQLTYSIITPPTLGGLSGAAPALTYTPNNDTVGEDSFTFKVNDGRLDSETVRIDLAIVNPNTAPIANSASLNAVAGVALDITLSGTDTEADDLTYTIVASPSAGELSGTPPNVTYVAPVDFSGEDSFTFSVNDAEYESSPATVQIAVVPNETPVGTAQSVEMDEDTVVEITLSATDAENQQLSYEVVTQPLNGTLTGTAPNLTYQANENYFGTDSFGFVASDAANNSRLEEVQITVRPVNDLPTVDAGVNQTVRLNESIVFRATATDVETDVEDFKWFDANDVQVAKNEGFVLLKLPSGKHTFRVQATDSDGAIAEDSIQITVVDEPLEPGVLTGIVYDDRDAIIVNARVSLPGSQAVVTNQYGEYRFVNVVPVNRTAVTAERSEFFANSEIVAIESGRETRRDIYLSRPASSQLIQTGTGGTVTGDGVTVEIPPDLQVVTQSGVMVDGAVELRLSYYQSTTEEDMVEFPGDSIGTNEQGVTGSLISYGFMKLDIVDPLGAPLALAPGQTLDVTLPADPTLDNPETIPFWYFDEELAEWVQDGVATLDPATNTYKAAVDRVLTTFNLDAFDDVLVNFNVCIVDQNGDPVAGYLGLEPIDKSWRNLSQTSEGGTVRLINLIGNRAFNVYAAANDGRLGSYPDNPILLPPGDNTLENCIVVEDTNLTNALSVAGSISNTDTADPISNDAKLTLYGDADGEFLGEPGRVEVQSVPISADGAFNLEFDQSSDLAIELGMFGEKTVTIYAQNGSSRAETEFSLERGVTSYPLPYFELIPNQPPRAQAGLDAIIYLGDFVSLDGSRSIDNDNTIVWDEWRIDDNVVSNASTHRLTGLGLGRHTIILTVEDEFGARSSDDITVDVVEKNHDIYAHAGVDQTIYVGERATIGATYSRSVGSSISYEWKLGETVLSNSSALTFTNTATPGEHVLTLTVTNTHGLIDTDEMVLSVVEKNEHFIYADAGLDRTAYVGETVSITSGKSRSVGSSISYEWTEDGEVLSSTSSFRYPDTSVAGEHTIKLTVSNTHGLVDSDEMVLSIVERNEHYIYADAGLDRTAYVGETVSLGSGNSRSVGSSISYEWTEDGEVLSSSSSFRYPDTSVAAKHTIKLTVSNAQGLVDSDEMVLSIVERNEHYIYADAGLDRTVYLGETASISSGESRSVGSSISYEWSEAGEVLSTNPSFSYPDTSVSGEHTIVLTVSNTQGLVDSDEMVLSIVGRNEHFVYADAGLDRTAYVGETIGISSENSRSVGSSIRYEWSEDGAVLSTGSAFTYPDTSSAGEHTIRLTVSNAQGLVDSDEMLLSIVERNEHYIYADAGLDRTIYVGETVSLSSGNSWSVGSSISYEWSEGGQVLSTSASFSYPNTSAAGEHIIRLTVSNAQGLVDTDEMVLKVIAEPIGTGDLFANAGKDISVYLGSAAVLRVTGSYANNGGMRCNWAHNTELVSESCGFYSFIPDAPGVYTYTLTISDVTGLEDTDEVVVTVVERDMRILADGGKDRSIYLGKSTVFYANQSYSLTSSLSCEWTKGGELLSTACSFFYETPDTLGEHIYTLTVSDSDGLEDTDQVLVTVVERDMRILADAGKDRSIYLGNTTQLYTTGSYSLTSRMSCEWGREGEIISTSCYGVSVAPESLGEHIYTLTVSDSDGLEDTDQVLVTVVERDMRILADAGKDRSIYLGNTTQLYTTGSYSLTSRMSCEWGREGEIISTNCYGVSVAPESLGEHIYTLTVSDSDGLEDTDQVLVTVVERDMRILADAGKDRSIYLGNTTQLYTTGSYSLTSRMSCEWGREGEIISTNCYGVSVAPESLGEHIYTLTVSDSDGLEDTDQVLVTVVERDMRILADAGKDRSIYLGNTTQLYTTGSYSLTSRMSCEWGREGEIISTNCYGVSVAPESLGVYRYTLTVRDSDGLEDTDQVLVTVIERDKRIYADAGLDQFMYLGDAINVGAGNESHSLTSTRRCEWTKDTISVSTSCSHYNFRPDTLGIHNFSLRVYDDDGLEDHDEVRVIVLDPSLDDDTPPQITLRGNPVVSMIQGDAYIDAGAIAFDSKDGIISDSILINDSALIIHQIGSYVITYTVSDQAGNTSSTTRTVNVLPVGSDIVAPQITLNGYNPTSLVQGNTYTDAGAVATDNVDGPVGYRFDSNVDTDKQGVYEVIYTASDAVGNTSQQNRVVRVTDAAGNIDIQAPAITLLGDELIYLAVGKSYQDAGATATDNIDGDISATIEINNPVDSSIIGHYMIHYTVQDSAGNTGYASREVRVLAAQDIPDEDPPQVALLNLTDGGIVSAPQVITATIEDARLESWQLHYRASDQSEYLTLATGADQVIDESIADFDPTLLMNGQYQFRLQASDEGGRTSTELVSVVIEGNMKVGNFSLAFEDLSIPMSGLPITINRRYDSRQSSEQQDFGFGWSVDYQDVEINETHAPGALWSLNQYGTGPLGLIPDFCIESNGEPKVTVSLPGGEVETFSPKANPECNAIPVLEVSIEFEADAGTTSTLRALNNTSGRYNAGTGNISEITEEAPLDPSRYELTTKAGYIYTLSQAAGIETVVDPNGNTITYSDTGISHSAGKSITFTRDSENRITEIEDPNGKLISYNYDANGDLSGVTDRAFATTSYTYNNAHGLLEIQDPLGQTPLKNIYDDNGRLVAQEDSDGNRTQFNHDIEGRQSIVTDRLGRTTLLYYDERGNVTSEVDALGHTTTRSYDTEDNQLSETNALGHTTSMTWDDDNNQLSQTDPLGNTVNYAYNSLGQETEITDELGRIYNNTYDGVGNLLTLEDPQGNTAGNNINAQGLVTLMQDMLGNKTRYEYDSEGNKTKEIDPTGAITTYTYDSNNNQLTETLTRTVNGATLAETSTNTYNARDQLTQTTDALGNITKFEYDLKGQESAQIDAKGNRTEMAYDTYGRLTKTTYPDGTSSSHSYDAEGNKLTDTDRLGRITRYTYDALNRVIKTTAADGAETSSVYDAAGRMTSSTDARGNTTRYQYDDANRRTAVTDALNNRHQYTYDAAGNITTETDARSHTLSYTYNSLDQRTRMTYADDSSTQDTLDALGRRTAMTDEASVSTAYAYDELGRLTSVTDAAGNITRYTYDEAGNKLTQTDAEGRTTSWAYDALGRQISRTLPLGQTETFQYDGNGNRTSHTDFNGNTHTMVYDNLDRMAQANYADGSVHSYVYDAEGNRTQASISDATGTRTWDYTYDTRNRLTQETKPDGSTLAYQYDVASNKTQLIATLANGDSQAISYTYDALNRLETVTNADGTSSYGYDEVGNRTSLSYPNGASQTWVYDSRNRLTKTSIFDGTGALIQSFDYTLHPTGRRTQITELDGRTSDYAYNDRYWLTSEDITDAVNGDYSASYECDKVGNRIVGTEAGVTTAYSYDANDRISQQGGVVYSYDSNGNTLIEDDQGSVTNYSWNSRNQMVGHLVGGIATQYQYNPEGIRHGQSDSLSATGYLVDSNRAYAQVLAESVDGVTDVVYHFGDDLISQTRDSQSHYFHVDGLGSTRVLTDAVGVVSDGYAYAAFGEVLSQIGVTDNSYLFAGEQYDSSLDQYYLRARYYDQGVGRFTRMDDWMGTQQDPMSLHKYNYAHANPVAYNDPSGRFLSSSSSALSSMASLARAQSIAAMGVSQLSRAAVTRLTVATAAALSGTYVAANSANKTMIKECIKSSKSGAHECSPDLDILVIGDNYLEAREHIGDAQSGGKPSKVRRQNPPHSRGWLKGHKGPGKACDGGANTDCDEYPFAANMEGGAGGDVSLRSINYSDNRGAGSTLRWFHSFCGVKPGETYKVLPVKGIDVSGPICSRK